MLHAFILLFTFSPWLLAAKPNILIITPDDMSWDSVGVFDCKMKDTTPHMDHLAARSLRFHHAHVVVGVTLKDSKGARLHRIEILASGEGIKEFTLDIPADMGSVSSAGLGGNSIKYALQHLPSKPVKVK